MAGLTEIRATDPAQLGVAATELVALNKAFTDAVDGMHGDVTATLAGWSGDTAAAASARTAAERVAGSHIGTAVDAQIDALSEASAALGPARQTVLSIADEAVANGCTPSEDGRVRAPNMGTLPLQSAADEVARGFEARLVPAIYAFNELDIAAAAALRTATTALEDLIRNPSGAPPSNAVTDILSGKRQLPADPKAFHDLWETLTPAEKDALWTQNQYLGNTDGMPAVDRDHYNRIKLADELARARAGEPSVAGKLPDLEQINAQLHGDGDSSAPLDPNRQLLLLDTQTGQNARAAISLGNPDTADHVSTYVPGTGSQPSKMSEDMTRCDRMQDEALRSGADNASVIAWFGYDSPPTPVDVGAHLNPFAENNDASNIDYADRAAPALDRFQDGLRVTHEGPPSYNTVVGHSYGTTVVGDAAAHGRSLNADAIALVASPGATVDHAAALRLTGLPQDQVPGRVFATAAENDPVPLAAHEKEAVGVVPIIGGWAGALGFDGGPFGTDPTGSDFGGEVFASDPGSDSWWGYSTAAHSEYWDYGPTGEPSKSLANLGAIIAGQQPVVS